VRRLVVCVVVVIALATTVFFGGGYLLFSRPQGDPLTKADAIVVLGGDEDGRVDYGLKLAHQGYADTVVISNSYPEDNRMIRRACASGTATITVVCFVPDPWTTQGEAMFTAKLAAERGWNHVIVVSWNFHLVRARYIFDQCFGGRTTMVPVPRSYRYNAADWVFTYSYQYAALAKAVFIGC
jgi:uncharacterized SAM-binding protein YcdF (DUF218 family)